MNNEHASTRYDCIDLNFRQIYTVIEVLPLPCLHNKIVMLYHWHVSCFKMLLPPIVLVRECIWCTFVRWSLTLGASGFIGPVTFEIYKPPGPVASQAYYGGLV